MRASDADRDRIADQLREALADGRLTPEEHSDRLDAVYQAKTYAELAPIVHDLPATGGVHAPQSPPVASDDLPAPRPGTPNIIAILSGAQRKGRWMVEPDTNVVTVCGGVELDLRQAVLSRREVTINIVAIMGGVDITVPPGVRVVDSMASILGGTSIPSDDTTAPDAPVIRLTGMNLLSGVNVNRRTGDAKGSTDHRERHHEERRIHRQLREQQRELHREFREQRRELRRRD
jgi:DUF1707 SHOCT-like domain/Cell wall-active antibiotics response LiaF, C-terminal